jgi:hypothetical protein
MNDRNDQHHILEQGGCTTSKTRTHVLQNVRIDLALHQLRKVLLRHIVTNQRQELVCDDRKRDAISQEMSGEEHKVDVLSSPVMPVWEAGLTKIWSESGVEGGIEMRSLARTSLERVRGPLRKASTRSGRRRGSGPRKKRAKQVSRKSISWLGEAKGEEKGKLTSFGLASREASSSLCSDDSLCRRLGKLEAAPRGKTKGARPDQLPKLFLAGPSLQVASSKTRRGRGRGGRNAHKVDVLVRVHLDRRAEERMSQPKERPYEQHTRGNEEVGGDEELEVKVPVAHQHV